MKMLKKTVALVMALVLTLCLVPLSAMASETEETAAEMPQMPAAQTEAAEAPEKTPETVPEESMQETAQVPELEPIQPGQVVEYIPTQVNPRYADLYTADDFDIPAFPSDTGDADIMATNTFVSKEEAAAQLRTKMTNRVGTVTLYLKGPISSTSATAYDLIDMAMVHTGNPKEGDYLMWHWATWEAKVTKQRNGSSYDYIYEYALTYHTTYNQEYELDNYILSLIWQLNIRNASDYQKIKAVYEYMCKNITYDDTSSDDDMLKHTAYSALVKKKAVCQGYASLFYRILLELGVDCRVIAGIGGGGAHGWNIVKLDGLYYNLDATWDAGTTDYTYFLGSMWEFLDHARYLEYETWEFHEQYPMAAEKYVVGEKGEMDPYIYVGVCGDEALFLLSRDGTLEIGGSGVTYDYKQSGDLTEVALWNYWADHITGVIVYDGITGIGLYNFYELKGLESASLAESVTTIGEYAFYGCTALSKLELSSHLSQVQEYAFAYCSALTDLQLPEDLVEIKDFAFAYCHMLTGIKLPSKIAYIGDGAFHQCYGITEVTIPGTVTHLDGFSECTQLTSAIICEGITQIEESAFAGCAALVNVSLPESLVTICKSAFKGIGVTELRIPSGVTTIQSSAFASCDALKELTVPKNVTSLNGFSACKNLETVYLNNSGTVEIGAFRYCSNLKSLIIGENLSAIKDDAFYRCTSLVTVTVPENVKEVGGFDDCDNLETVYLNCEILSAEAFLHCSSLKSVSLGNNIEYIGRDAFANCFALTEIIIPDSVTSMGNGVFSHCYLLNSVKLSNSLQEIPDYTFYDCCWGLADITIPAGVNKIGNSCFEDCSKLTAVRFRGDAPYFSYFAFKDAKTVVYYPAGNVTWTDKVKMNYGGTITWIPFDSKVDLNSDMNVDDADVEYLLWHTLFPDMYPIESDVDLNGDGLINDGDVEYLLWHILFPDMYPV